MAALTRNVLIFMQPHSPFWVAIDLKTYIFGTGTTPQDAEYELAMAIAANLARTDDREPPPTPWIYSMRWNQLPGSPKVEDILEVNFPDTSDTVLLRFCSKTLMTNL